MPEDYEIEAAYYDRKTKEGVKECKYCDKKTYMICSKCKETVVCYDCARNSKENEPICKECKEMR